MQDKHPLFFYKYIIFSKLALFIFITFNYILHIYLNNILVND